jgi:hypothetical protein
MWTGAIWLRIGSYKHGNYLRDAYNAWYFIELLSNYWLIKNNSTPGRQLVICENWY